MSKSNILKAGFVFAGMLALTATGCGKSFEEQAVLTGEKEIMQAKAQTGPKALHAEKTEENQGSGETGQVLQNKKGVEEREDPQLVQASRDALKKYFEIDLDNDPDFSKYTSIVTHFDAWEDMPGSYIVDINTEQNADIYWNEDYIGPDGYPAKEAREKLKPTFLATFSEERQLTGLYVNDMGWEESEVPLSVEESKAAAKDFVESRGLVEDGKIELLGISILSGRKTGVIYQNGGDGAVSITVDILTGKVDNFQYMSKEQALIIVEPKEEGYGMG